MFLKYPEIFSSFASFSVRNAYFFKDYNPTKNSSQVFFVDNTVRSNFSPKWESGKSLVLADNALTVFNHYALHSLRPGVRKTFFLPTEKIQMNHYRKTCTIGLLPECMKYLFSPEKTRDNSMKRYLSEFSSVYTNTIEELTKKGILWLTVWPNWNIYFCVFICFCIFFYIQNIE